MLTNDLILQRLDSLSDQVAQLAERQRAREELVEEMTPIAREALGQAIERLDALDKAGVFAFAAEAGRVGKRVLDNFTPDDVRQLGDAIVTILDAVRALTRPEVMQIASDAAAALQAGADAKPLGAFGAIRATRNDDVQKGLGLFISILRSIGHGMNAANAEHHDRKSKLAELLGPRRTRKLPARERKLLPAPPPVAAGTPRCATPRPSDVDVSAWSPAVAEQLAAEQHIVLDAERWAILDAARTDFVVTKAAPNIQRLTQVAGISTKDLYRLFPKAPARTIAKLAGLPKPAGCL
ncbi:MAG TPA: TusE/DsrC/DsvC family sulfur relay protein [Kofleriaceae bacterium]|nr:TusE/DsrC/DsvC family sulfur relay protein [Kofleriaceae bacterium]